MNHIMPLFRQLITLLIIILSTAAVKADGSGKIGSRLASKFAWGAEAGTGIDMGGDNMSTLNLRAHFGYSGPWLELIGLGAGVDMVMSNSCRSYPVYGVVRTGFSSRRRLLFAEMRGGVAFNYAPGVPDRTNLFLQPGAGIHLATGRTYASYLTLSYVYNAMTFYGDKNNTLIHGVNLATLAIGVVF